jgi:hypothetical protein
MVAIKNKYSRDSPGLQEGSFHPKTGARARAFRRATREIKYHYSRGCMRLQGLGVRPPGLGVNGEPDIRYLTPLARMRFPLYPSARVPRRRCTRYPVPGYGGIFSSHLKKNTDTACHASAPLRWSQAVLAAFWCRSFSSAGRGHAMVRQGVSAY